jgi:hypothetical protein
MINEKISERKYKIGKGSKAIQRMKNLKIKNAKYCIAVNINSI